MSLPEVLLWQRLRGEKTGVKFRQDPVGPYVVDFCCREARLIVEVDGEAHNRGERPMRDETRETFLKPNGCHVIRLPASEVLRDADGAASSIAALVANPLHRPADGLPPRAGEDLQ